MVILGAGNISGHCHILSPDQLIVFAFSSTYSLLSLNMFPVLAQYDLLVYFLGLGWIAALTCYSTRDWPWGWPHASSTLGGRAGWFLAFQP
jgi:hypothetical protein